MTRIQRYIAVSLILAGMASLAYILLILSIIVFFPMDDGPILWDRLVIGVAVLGGLGAFLVWFGFRRLKVLK